MIFVSLVLSLSALAPRTPAAPGVITPTAAPNTQATAPELRMLRLRSGDILWGTIQEHTSDGIRFARIDTGGQAELPWRFLAPIEENELKTLYGYVDTTGDDVYVQADRILLTDGTEVIGRIVARTGDGIVVRTADSEVPVPVQRLAGQPSVVSVPALDVFSREELYEAQLALTDLEDARSQYELAEYCERIRDYAHALEHYSAVAAMGGTFDPGDLTQSVTRSRSKAERQNQVDYLANVDRLIRRKRFDEAFNQANDFANLYGESPLLPDAAKLRDRSLKRRDAAVMEENARSFRKWTRILTAKAGRDMSYEGVMAYLGEGLVDDIVVKVHEDLTKITQDVSPEDVVPMWMNRGPGKWNKATYGVGTWLLGKDEALKGSEEGGGEKEPTTEKDAERKKLEDRVKRFFENQDRARSARRQDNDADDFDKFWKEFSSAGRQSFVLAWFVEKSGLFEVRDKPLLSNCRECGGTGAREIINTGSSLSSGEGASSGLVECPTCHGVAVTRRIVYR